MEIERRFAGVSVLKDNLTRVFSQLQVVVERHESRVMRL